MMGWASGTNYEGRTVGYGHRSVCEHDDCGKRIDLGLSYCCGDLDGVIGERGCGHYFCSEHLLFSFTGEGNRSWEGQRCGKCSERILAGETEPFGEEE